MKKVMSIAAIALMMAGSAAFACDTCGCSAKKAEKKAECTKKCDSSCTKGEEKKCAEGCSKKSCSKKAEDKK